MVTNSGKRSEQEGIEIFWGNSTVGAVFQESGIYFTNFMKTSSYEGCDTSHGLGRKQIPHVVGGAWHLCLSSFTANPPEDWSHPVSLNYIFQS